MQETRTRVERGGRAGAGRDWVDWW